jgi:hypothetical protein
MRSCYTYLRLCIAYSDYLYTLKRKVCSAMRSARISYVNRAVIWDIYVSLCIEQERKLPTYSSDSCDQ